MRIANFFGLVSLKRKSLRYKLLLAFSVMSIVPLLVMTYIVTNYVVAQTRMEFLQMSAVVLFTFWLVLAGYILAKKIIIPVIDLALETKIIAEGNLDSKISVKRDDEIGVIVGAVNTMTDKMRGYLKDLQDYSRETALLNVKIHRKVLTLTNLMRLGDMISSGTNFDEIASFAAERMAGELYGGFCAVFVREKTGTYAQRALVDKSEKNIPVGDISSRLSALEKLFSRNEYLSLNSHSLMEEWQKELRKKLPDINVVLFPMRIKSNVIGIIVFGNFGEGVEFTEEDLEVLRAFEKEIVLGYQSSEVLERVKSLEVVDSLTGLYTFGYLEDRLEDEINRAVYYQRPCSLIVLNVDDFSTYSNRYGIPRAKEALKRIGKLLNEVVPPVGKIARSDRDEFGVLLPEKNKRESLVLAEDIRKRLEELKFSEDKNERLTATIGVGENPIDGANAKEIIARARHYIEKAKVSGKNKVLGE